MPEQKKDQVRTVQNEAGGVSGRTGANKGNPRPSHRPTVSRVPQAFTKLGHRVLVVPAIECAAIDLVDRKINRGPFTKGY